MMTAQFDAGQAADLIASHGFGPATEEGMKLAKSLFDAGEAYSDIGFEVVSRGLTDDSQL